MTNQLDQDSKEKKANPLLKIILGVTGVLIILCGVLIVGLFYQLGYPYLGPRTHIVLAPDDSLVSPVDPADLIMDAEILSARAQALGVRVSFAVTENNQIVADVPNSVDMQSFVGNTTQTGLLELVDFGTTAPSEGLLIATDFKDKYLPQGSGLQWHTLITNSDFREAAVQKDQSGKYQIAFILNSNGAEILSNYTTNNVGQYLGIVLDKMVLSVPRINAPILNGEGLISGNFTKEQAEALAAYLHLKGPLPVPLKVESITQNDN